MLTKSSGTLQLAADLEGDEVLYFIRTFQVVCMGVWS